MYAKTFWGGFVEGNLDKLAVDTGWGGYGNGELTLMPAIFATRKAAREKYQDVRRVDVTTQE
jgi:hypothetical protein